MDSFKRLKTITGWIVFAITFFVYYLSVERTGSLWDCGEFITGAYKLEVVHPPGAPLFILIGRMFTFLAEIISSNPADIAFAVNLMSGMCSAFLAMFICWTTIRLGKMVLVGRDEAVEGGDVYALLGAGLIAGLCSAWISSVWFSAVEGEVYSMSSCFTAMTLWVVVKWYTMPDSPKADRWIILAIYLASLSIGVHLLSILTFPALALFYYFKKYENHNIIGMGLAVAAGLALIVFIQKFVIVGVTTLWRGLEYMAVNSFGLPFHSGAILTVLLVGAALFFGIRFAHQKRSPLLQMIFVGTTMIVIGYSLLGIVVIRANANTPINMNNPSDPFRLMPYINREQYGERPFLYGAYFGAKPQKSDTEPVYGQLGDKYEEVDHKISYVYKNSDKMLFPRMGDYTQGRPELYKRYWLDGKGGKPSQMDNLRFMFRYQLGWMYWRYFMWNFAGRQNGEQGYHPDDPRKGHWISGIPFIDNYRLYDQSDLPDTEKYNKARNTYYMLPFLFGLIGFFFHATRRRKDFIALLTMFVITGIGIVIYSNQPPHEPRERDYVLAGSFFTYCIWIGLGMLALFRYMRERNVASNIAMPAAFGLVLLAPILLVTQNFDDNTRRHHSGARDYASNFLNSVEENAIIFTYGDNDTYPLWYAQEVENIRRDVRVVNLSLIAVDWYIDQLRRKVNDSPPIKMTVSAKAIRGKKRNQIIHYSPPGREIGEMSLQSVLKFIGEDHPLGAGDRRLESYLPTKKLFIPVDKQAVIRNKVVDPRDTTLQIVDRMNFTIKNNQLLKGDVAVLDIIGSNIWDRPVYFAVTCRPESLMGLDDYLQLEGLALRVIPVKSKSDDPLARAMGMMGKGRIDSDILYDNFMNKFTWGGFDKHDLYVDRSYGPSIQSHRVAVMRAAGDLVRRGDRQKAVSLLDKYFEAFPHMNFPYDFNTLHIIRAYLSAGAFDKAKPHLKILAEETADYLEFYFSIGDGISDVFAQDFAYVDRTREELLRLVAQGQDAAFKAEIEKMLEPYKLPSK